MGTHSTAKEIYEAVRYHLPQISLGTVYQNLGALEDLGLLRRLECVNCNQVYDIDQSLAQNLNVDLLRSQGFKLLDYKLDVYGLCPNCHKTES